MNVCMTSYSRLSSFAQLITLFLVFIFVLALTYFSTMWMAKQQKQQFKCTNIEVVETFRISNTKYIQIVRVGSKYVAISVCKDTVTMLAELEESELELGQEQGNSFNVDFREVLKKVKEMNKRKSAGEKDEEK